jgi:hypothetical protein
MPEVGDIFSPGQKLLNMRAHGTDEFLGFVKTNQIVLITAILFNETEKYYKISCMCNYQLFYIVVNDNYINNINFIK